MQPKTIWIVNFHTAPPQYALNQRYAKMVPVLQSKGYRVKIISSAYLRRHKLDLSQGKVYREVEYDGIPFIHIKSNKYKGNGIGRMLSLFIFAIRVVLIGKKYGRPDIIYHNLHVPFDLPVYFLAKKLRSKYIAEVWDLWPEFFYRSGLIRKNHFLMKLAYKLEKWIYAKSHKIIFTLEGGSDYIVQNNWDAASGGPIDLSKVHYINNGIDLEQYEIDKQSNIHIDPDMEANSFNVLYVGSMHKANDITKLVDAAKYLVEYKDIQFYLFGDGAERVRLEQYCEQKLIYNVHFKATYLPFNKLPSLLTKSSLNILNYQKDFGDYGISAGKLFLYLAAGKPILSNVKLNYSLIEKYNLGISEDLLTPKQYTNAILSIYHLRKTEYNKMCERVLMVSQQYDYKVLANKLVNVFQSVN